MIGQKWARRSRRGPDKISLSGPLFSRFLPGEMQVVQMVQTKSTFFGKIEKIEEREFSEESRSAILSGPSGPPDPTWVAGGAEEAAVGEGDARGGAER